MSGLARDAVLPVDKPEGPTSHDVVAMARRSLGERRVGHTGTLDPFASGLLLLCVGKATRIAEFLTGMDKSYEAVARLGTATDTLDRDGEVVAVSEGWRGLGAGDVERALAGLRGTISQVPPRYSAKKVGGVAAHRMARRGEAVDLPPTQVTVHELRVTFYRPPDLGLKIVCSSGTYVRALARDLGSALGVGAHLTALRRTAVGRFRVEDALGLDDLSSEDRLGARWIQPLAALAALPRTKLDESTVADVRHGRAVAVCDVPDGTPVVASREEVLVAVGEVRDGRFRPRKVFVDD
ncbi:MAG: tRNA pseudouridine(55) synthase TruB [Gemmatimonadetes bacterium]|nr:tRNA pseudouridine(55) synthase TruB [Gemmatimonadota bacterium]